MSKIHVISDLHLGHHNIAVARGFKNSEEHDAYLIKQWNKVISKRDTVWILGDITMEKTASYPLLLKLNGIKKVVLGNHDKPQHIRDMLNYVSVVCGMYKLKGAILTHCPIHESEIGRFKKNIHGHVHEKSLDDDRYINVSCDVVDFTPQPLDNLLAA